MNHALSAPELLKIVSLRWVFFCLFVIVCFACTSGLPENQNTRFKVGSSLKIAALEHCVDGANQQGKPTRYVRDEDRCVEAFAPMNTKTQSQPLMKRLAAATRTPITFAQLLAWAEKTYPNYFSGTSSEGMYEGFTYRHYTKLDNYLAQKDGKIYVLGTITDWNLLFVGALTDFQCVALTSCGDGQASTTNYEVEPNNGFDSAQPIVANARYSGTLSEEDYSADFYRLSITAPTSITITLNIQKILDRNGLGYTFPLVELSIFDSTRKQIQTGYVYDGESSVLIKDALAGSYTIRIQTPFQLGTLSYPSKIQYELGYVLATSNTSSSNGTATNTSGSTSGVTTATLSCKSVPLGTSPAPNRAPYNQIGVSEKESSNPAENPNILSEGVWINASLSSASDVDYYDLKLPRSVDNIWGVLEVNLPNLSDQDASYIEAKQAGSIVGLRGGLNVWRWQIPASCPINGACEGSADIRVLELSDSSASVKPKAYQVRFYLDPSKGAASGAANFNLGERDLQTASPANKASLPTNRALTQTIQSDGLVANKAVSLSSKNADHVVVQLSDGTYWGWGSNMHGQLLPEACGGVIYTPLQLDIDPKLYTKVIATDQVTFAFGPNVDPVGWGNNSKGILGDGTTTAKSGITKIKNTGPIQSIATNGVQAAAVGIDGTLWIWGDGYYDRDLSYTPHKVGSGYRSVVSANGAFFALSADGTVFILGLRDEPINGELGRVLKKTENPRVPFPLLTNVKQVEASIDTGYAIKTDGSLWTWGWNRYGQLGENKDSSYKSIDSFLVNSSKRETPQQVGQGYSKLYTGPRNVVGVKTDGTVWGWGDNLTGELALPAPAGQPSPAPYRQEAFVGLNLTNAEIGRSISLYTLATGELLWFSRNATPFWTASGAMRTSTGQSRYVKFGIDPDPTLPPKAQPTIPTTPTALPETTAEDRAACAKELPNGSKQQIDDCLKNRATYKYCKVQSANAGRANDLQYDSFCNRAALDLCMVEAGYPQFADEGNCDCVILADLVKSTGVKWACGVCENGFRAKPSNPICKP